MTSIHSDIIMVVLGSVSRFLFKKLIQFERAGVPKRCVAGVLPFPGFLLKDQPASTPPPSQGDTPKAMPKPHPNHSQTQSAEDGHSRRFYRRAAQQTRHSKKPKVEVSKVEKQRSSLLLDNSELSSEGWSDSDGELVIDTPAVASSVKKEGGRRKRKEPPVVSVKKSVEEEVCDEGEGKEGWNGWNVQTWRRGELGVKRSDEWWGYG